MGLRLIFYIIPSLIGSGHPISIRMTGCTFSNPLTIYFRLPLLASDRHFVYSFKKFLILLNLGDIGNIGLN